VEIEVDGGVRRYDGLTRDDVPELVRGLVREGEHVYAVKVLTSTLEDVYLEAVGEDAR
jgi:ABC-2 type transport system ATP-binding protein